MITRTVIPRDDTFYHVQSDPYHVPVLDLAQQATYDDALLLSPRSQWGRVVLESSRIPRLFYVDDTRFQRIARDPSRVLRSPPVALGELNFSARPETPYPVVLFDVYRKRWLSRHFQAAGIRIFADLNVARNWAELNTVGIPPGWRPFATRGHVDRISHLYEEYLIAKRIAAPNIPIFVVWGGGRAVADICKDLPHTIHIEEPATAFRRNNHVENK